MSIHSVKTGLIAAIFHAVILSTVLLAQSKGNSQQNYNENDFEPYGIYSTPDGYIEIVVVGPHIVGFFTDVKGDITADCGSCSNGQYCSTSGTCTTNLGSNNSSTNQDSCSQCLSNCQGLPSCCIGSGCFCQQECTVSSTDCVEGTSFCCGPYGDCFCMANCPY